MEAMSDNGGEPVSPLAQTFSTSFLSVCVQAIFELEQPIDVSSGKKAIEDILLPSNSRFCSIMEEDKDGVLRWVRTEVNVDDHIIIPHFPPGQTEYDEYVNEYICNMHLIPLPKNRPLWQFHFLNYNTSRGRATLIINMHHSLGDGTSLMSLLFCCVSRADDPNLPLTFPSSKSPPCSPPCYSWHSMLKTIFVLLLVLWYTLSDFIGSLLRMIWVKDSKIAIRGPPGVEMLPKVMTHVTFPLEDIKKIKNSIGGTVNDVIMGVIFYGFQRYLQVTHYHGENQGCGHIPSDLGADSNNTDVLIAGGNSKEMRKLRVTGLVAINTRLLSGLKDIKDMMKAESGAPWGNHLGMLHIPMLIDNVESPLDFVWRAKKLLDQKKMSREVFITGRLLSYMGREAAAIRFYKTLANATLAITNLIGPMEKIAINRNPVKNMFFSCSGVPQTLLLTMVSYMGKLRLDVIGVEGYVDCHSLAKCFAECFEEIKETSNAL